MGTKRRITTKEAKLIGMQLNINTLTNVTNDDLLTTGKIALAHLNEFSDYYTRLLKMEKEAKRQTE